MAQWISIEEAAAKYGFETEYIWVLIYLSLLGKQDKEITRYKAAGILYDTLQIKWLKQCDRLRKLEKELVLGQTTCCTCWLKRICMKIRK